jgi:hypothetical protein
LVYEIIDDLIHNSNSSLKSELINLKSIPLIEDSNPILSKLDKVHKIPDGNENQIFM